MLKFEQNRACVFDFLPPKGYHWLLERELVGFDPSTALQPWFYLDKNASFDVSAKWPNGPSKNRLVAFARRQDCDDLACFRVVDGKVMETVLIHGWTADGYEVISSYQEFWGWLKAIIDDIAEWSAQT